MNIEEYINSRRDQLDIETPPSDIWSEINGTSIKPPIQWWRYAAIFLLFTTTLMGFYISYLQGEVDERTRLGDLSQEYLTLEQEYLHQISLLEENVDFELLAASQNHNWLVQELQSLDKVNELFLEDLSTSAPEEQIAKALIDYYEKKIRILNKIELEQKRSTKHQKNEASNYSKRTLL